VTGKTLKGLIIFLFFINLFILLSFYIFIKEETARIIFLKKSYLCIEYNLLKRKIKSFTASLYGKKNSQEKENSR